MIHQWHSAGLRLSALEENKLTEITVAQKRIGLLKRNGSVYAFTALCPHASAPLCTGWVDPQFDLLDKKANETLDPKTRFSLLQEAESRLLKEAPIAPIFYGTKTYLISPAVHNWESSLLGIHRYQFVDLISP